MHGVIHMHTERQAGIHKYTHTFIQIHTVINMHECTYISLHNHTKTCAHMYTHTQRQREGKRKERGSLLI